MNERVSFSSVPDDDLDARVFFSQEAQKKGLEPILDDDDEAAKNEEDVITVAFGGMPKVGKSTLVNATLGETRLITSDVSGTTRDSVLVDYQV